MKFKVLKNDTSKITSTLSLLIQVFDFLFNLDKIIK